MQRILWCLYVLVLSFPSVVLAWNPFHVWVLEQTGSCPGCDFSGIQWSDREFNAWQAVTRSGLGSLQVGPPGNLQGANFSGAQLHRVRFLGVNLNGANFSEATLVGDSPEAILDFSGSWLRGANFRRATLRWVSFYSGALHPRYGVALPPAVLTQSNWSFSDVQSTTFNHGYVDDALFYGATLRNCFGDQSIFSGSSFENASIIRSQWDHAQFADCDDEPSDGIAESDLSLRIHLTICSRSSIFLNTHLDGSSFRHGMFGAGRFTNVSMERSNFSGAQLTGRIFEGVSAQGAIFDEAELSATQWVSIPTQATNLSQVSFQRAHLENAILGRGINASGASFRGAFLLDRVFLPGCDVTADQTYAADPSTCDHYQNKIIFQDGVDLSQTDFSGTRLNGLDLSWKNLSGSQLSYSVLTRTNFTGSRLRGSQLNDVFGVYTQLDRSDLQDASLQRARIPRASALGVHFLRADMTDMSAENIQADGADFFDARMVRTNLHFASLRQCQNFDLARALVQGALLDEHSSECF